MRLLAVFLLAGAAWAQGVPFDRTGLGMLPGIEQGKRAELLQIHGAGLREVAKVSKKIGKIDQQLRKKPAKAQRRKLAAERARLAKRLPQLYAQLEQKMRDAGVDEAQLARLKRMPRGPLREERYNHSILLETPGLSAGQRALLHHLVAATDSAQSATREQKNHLLKGIEKGKENEILRRRIANTCDRQCSDMERRFWRAAYYTLSPAQMREARKLLSPRYSVIPENRRQFYLLPGMTPSQATRVQALFNELDSEKTADDAEVRQIRAQLKNKKLTQPERAELYRRNAAAYQRINEVAARTRKALFETLTPVQRDAYHALPPRLNIGERTRAPWDVLPAMRVAPAQMASVRAIQRELAQERKRIQQEQKRAKKDLDSAGLGPESPQMMTMTMMQQGARGAVADQHREAGQRLVVEILEPAQVANWVVSPTLKP